MVISGDIIWMALMGFTFIIVREGRSRTWIRRLVKRRHTHVGAPDNRIRGLYLKSMSWRPGAAKTWSRNLDPWSPSHQAASYHISELAATRFWFCCFEVAEEAVEGSPWISLKLWFRVFDFSDVLVFKIAITFKREAIMDWLSGPHFY
jgi:hypothetical protein